VRGEIDDDWWTWVVARLESGGPTFAKLCQWMATRRDLFPAPLCDKCSRLHHSARAHTWEATQARLVEALGEKLKDSA
jgi:aarF domain-containing kinase